MMNPALKKKGFLAAVLLTSAGMFAADALQVVAKSAPGRPLASVSERWIREALAEKPDVTVMLFGTNDACNSKVLSTPEAFREKLGLAVKLVRAGGSRLVLVTIPPCNEKNLFLRHKRESFGDHLPNQRILQFNAILKETAEAEKLPLADFHEVVMKTGCAGKATLLRIPETSGVADGIHLTDAGYAALARCVADTIRKAGYSPKKILCIGDSLTYGVGSRDAGKVSGNTYPGQLKKIFGQTGK